MDKRENGFSVDVLPGSSQPIASVQLSSVGFVGRTRRGPANRPVLVRSFADFDKQFGGLWLASPMSFAVFQFFENGGRAAWVVRVVSGGTRAAIDLPTDEDGVSLTLEAVNPGGYDFIRAAVDYDNIESPYRHLFNLTIQRTSAMDGGLVMDQEIYTKVSTVRGSDGFVATAVEESALVRIRGEVPLGRPLETAEHHGGYLGISRNGLDGDTVKDADILGCKEQHTGLFALAGHELPFVCLPPLSRHQDLQPETWAQALAFCRQSDAILLVDPPRTWKTVNDVRQGLTKYNIFDSHAAMMFPGFKARGKGAALSYHAPCGAVAGLLTREGVDRLSWEFPEGWRIRGVKNFETELTENESSRLNGMGVNCLREVNAVAKILVGDKTLARNEAWSSLTAARFAHYLRVSIKRGTQWAIFLPNAPQLWNQVREQVDRFMKKQFEWAVDARDLDNLFFVRCDASTNPPAEVDKGKLNIEVGFALDTPGKFHRITITHRKQQPEQV